MAEYLAQFPNFHIHNFERLFLPFAPNCLTAKVKTPFSNKLRVIRGYHNMVENHMKYTISSSIELHCHKATNAQVAVSHSVSLTAGAIAKQNLPIARHAISPSDVYCVPLSTSHRHFSHCNDSIRWEYVFKKRKTFQKHRKKYLITMIEFYHHFPF